MTNEVFEAISTVMAVREYADRELPDDVLRRIAEAGRLTASASNKQPWHFVVVREKKTCASSARWSAQVRTQFVRAPR